MRNVSAARAKVEPRLFDSTVSASASLEADKLLEKGIVRKKKEFLEIF
jgi:hypothetical protein